MDKEDDKITTLAVPMHFADKLREEFDGHNDFERLKDWKGINNDYKDSITVDDVEDAVSRALERDLPELLRREVRSP